MSPYQNANDLSSLSLELGLACKVPFQTEAEGIDHHGSFVGTTVHRLCEELLRHGATHLVDSAVCVFCILLGFDKQFKELKNV